MSLRTVCDWWVLVRGIEKFSVEVLEHGIVTGVVLLILEKDFLILWGIRARPL